MNIEHPQILVAITACYIIFNLICNVFLSYLHLESVLFVDMQNVQLLANRYS